MTATMILPDTTLTVGDLHFTLQRSARRKTMEITVDRDGELVIKAPPEVSDARLRRFIEEKRFWVYTKLAEKDRLNRATPRKEFVNGEGFLYLGRSYRLKLVDEQDVPLKLGGGRFLLRRRDLPVARQHFVRWYSEHAKPWLESRVAGYKVRMQVEPSSLKIQDLGFRWGSCGKGERLYFHWKTIMLPARLAEYVVVHEMAHLHERHHTPQFWTRIERAMPDYDLRRERLAVYGVEVEGL
jgi:predicted metal-dependent hydrolase